MFHIFLTYKISNKSLWHDNKAITFVCCREEKEGVQASSLQKNEI